MTRVAVETVDDDRYRITPLYGQQYASTYYMRLQLLRKTAVDAAAKEWNAPQAGRVLDIVPNQRAWVVGTIYREMANKPNILDDLEKLNHGLTPVHAQKYTTPMDRLFIEDEHGRLSLQGDALHMQLLVTGCVVAVLGKESSEGIFYVEDVKAPGLYPAPELPAQTGSPKVMLVSGLLLDNKVHESPAYQLLTDYVTGQLGDTSDLGELIIAGKSLSEPSEKAIGSRVQRPFTNAESVAQLQGYLRVLSSSVPVRVIPGSTDPTDYAMPQQPLHKGLFIGSKDLVAQGALTLCTNPSEFTINGVKFLGSGGQPITDLAKYADVTPVDLLQKTLEWRHMAPTTPDTLWSYPFPDDDPFVIKEAKHVYFAGNQPEFSTKVVNGVRIICVPEFATTGQAVVVDLSTLEVELMEFGPTTASGSDAVMQE